MKFTDEHEMFRRSVRRFVEEQINPHVDEWEEKGIWPAHDVLKKMGYLGFLGLTYAEERDARAKPAPKRKRAPGSPERV